MTMEVALVQVIPGFLRKRGGWRLHPPATGEDAWRWSPCTRLLYRGATDGILIATV